jgi:hypothetical protein
MLDLNTHFKTLYKNYYKSSIKNDNSYNSDNNYDNNDKKGIIVIYTKYNLNKDELHSLNKKNLEQYENRHEILLNTLTHLYNNFLKQYNYPIIILHEGYSDYDIHVIKNKFIKITFIFEKISTEIPKYLEIRIYR